MSAFTPVQLERNQNATDVTSDLATPAATTMTIPSTGKEFLMITNGATTATVTLDVAATVDGQAVVPFTAIAVAANSKGLFVGPFTPEVGAEVSGVNTVTVVFSNLTSVEAALLRMP